MKYNRGFSIVEVLVYLLIASVLLSMVLALYFGLAHARMRQQSVAEVETQGLLLMHTILQSVRNAHSITAPAAASSASALTLDPYATSTKPLVFTISNGVVYASEGVSAPVALTNSQIVVSGLTFQNVSRPGTKGSLKVQFTASHASTTRYSSQYEKTFYGSGTVRRLTQ